MLDFVLLQKTIEENDSFLLTTHVNPDADALGSEIALYNILTTLKKKVYIVNYSITPYNLEFLDKSSVIEQFSELKHSSLFSIVDVLVALDFNRSDRIVKMQSYFTGSNKIKICIDHHLDSENFVDHYFIDTDYAATGQILYDFIKSTGIVKLSKELAEPIYAAIMTDTGSFRYEKTNSHIHRIIADLIDNGADPTEIYTQIFDESKFGKIKLLGYAINSLELYGKKQEIGYMIIKQEDFNATGAFESDTDGFVSFTISIEQVRLGLMFIELKEGFKVSLRSKGNIPVNAIAGKFGGGGHLNASGIRIRDGRLEDYVQRILQTAETFL